MADLASLSDADLDAEFDAASKAAEEANAHAKAVSVEWHDRLAKRDARAYVDGLDDAGRAALTQVLADAGGIQSEEAVNGNG